MTRAQRKILPASPAKFGVYLTVAAFEFKRGQRLLCDRARPPALGSFIVLREHSKLRPARVISIDAGDEWVEPIDKDEVGSVWVGEEEARQKTDIAKLKMLRIPVHELWAQQPVTQKLLDTSFINVADWVMQKIADRFARAEGIEFVTGNAHLRPQGFATLEKSALSDFTRPATAVQYVNSGAAAAVEADGLRDLYWSLRSGHRANGVWVMASETANKIDRLKTGDGQYLWRSAMTSGSPNELLGRPVEFDENMPGVSAGAYPIAFADWNSFYTIVDLTGLRFLRDPFSAKPHVLFDAYKRVGGGVANTDAAKFMRIAASE